MGRKTASNVSNSKEKATAGSSRMANLELLRCVAMMMVVVLHFLGKGDILGELTVAQPLGSVKTTAWLLESFCIIAVNLYMLISGYFLCTSSFKLSRLLKLWMQIWFYSAGIGLLAYGLGICPQSELGIHYFLTLALPISMGHYWFMTAYVFLYIMLPLFGKTVREMSKGQMQAALGLLLFGFCILKSVVPARLEMDSLGYDVLWYLCVFMAAAYIRRFGWGFLQKKGCAIGLYLAAALAIFLGTMGLRQLYLKTGSFELIIKIFLEYNHILPLLASVGLFGAFLRRKVSGRFAGIINRVAPYTLGVYLLHENIGVRYAWQRWLGAEKVDSVASLFFYTAAAVVSVFTAGILVDMLRDVIMKGLHRVLSKWSVYRWVANKVMGVDEMFKA